MKQLPDTIFLKGQNITLTTLKDVHLSALSSIAKDPIIWQHLPIAAWQIPVFETWILESFRLKMAHTVHPFVVLDNNTGSVLGTSRYQDIYLEHHKMDIGWTWFARSAWGSGINTEVKYLMLRYAFETCGIVRIGFKVDERNIRSQRALEKIGAIREGVFRKHMIRPDGTARTSFFYSITDDDWEITKFHLHLLLNKPILETLNTHKEYNLPVAFYAV